MPWRYFWGLVLVFLGVGFIVREFTEWDFAGFLAMWWPLLIVLFGLNMLARHPRRPFGALIIIAIGALLLAGRLAEMTAGLWALFGAALLVLIGLWLLLPRRYQQPAPAREGEIPMATSAGDTINASATFSGLRVRNESRQFRGGSVTAHFGGAEVDLRNASLSPEGAVLNLDVAFGGIELRIPESWPLLATGSPAFGGCEVKVRNAEIALPGQAALRVHCSGILGGVTITN